MIRASRELAANRNQGVRAVGAGKAQVHQRDVGTMPAELGDRLDAVGRLGDEHHVRLGLDHGREALAKHRVVFDAQYAYRLGVRHKRLCVRAVYLTGPPLHQLHLKVDTLVSSKGAGEASDLLVDEVIRERAAGLVPGPTRLDVPLSAVT